MTTRGSRVLSRRLVARGGSGTLAPVLPDFAELTKLAREGDAGAWDEIVHGLSRLVWRAVADFGLSAADRQDAYAAAFFRLFERLDTIREPEKLPGWIATTARNEARTLLRARNRFDVRDQLGDEPVDRAAPDERMLDDELSTALKAAFGRLTPACQQLLRLVTAVPKLSYEKIGDLLDIPHGSIGPTRQRCLDRLRATPELARFMEGAQR